MNKKQLLSALKQEHPQVTLTVGTLKANTQACLRNEPDLANELVQLLEEAVREANKVKREAQRLIGRYVELMARVIQSNPTREVEPEDRRYLDGLCQRISKEKEGGKDDDAPASSGFLTAILRCLYSGNEPSEKLARGYMKRLKALGLYESPTPLKNIWSRHPTAFTPSDLVRSVSTQLAVELMKMYCHGTIEMQEKVLIAPMIMILYIFLKIQLTNAFPVDNSSRDWQVKKSITRSHPSKTLSFLTDCIRTDESWPHSRLQWIIL